MSSTYRPKHERVEKETELFRIHLENTLTMDTLTGWIKKIVEVPPNKRPANVLKFFIEVIMVKYLPKVHDSPDSLGFSGSFHWVTA
nr:unnamed protein product [Haemonchus contortus]